MYEPEKKNAANTVGVLLKIIFSIMAKDKVKVSVSNTTEKELTNQHRHIHQDNYDPGICMEIYRNVFSKHHKGQVKNKVDNDKVAT